MEEFYIDVEFNNGKVRLQVDEVPPENWDIASVPQFIVEFHNGSGFITMTLQLENGKWYDRNTRVTEDDACVQYFDIGPDALTSNYQSPLSDLAIQKIGQAISRHMIVLLTAYMALFIPTFREPTMN